MVGLSVAANSGTEDRIGAVSVSRAILYVVQARSRIQISLNSIANAATNVSGAVSPGLSVVISVPGIGPADRVDMQLSDDGLYLTTQLGETRILFDGIAAPMLYAANGQFGAIVPYEVAGQDSTQLQVEFQGVRSNSVTVPVVLSSPGHVVYSAHDYGPSLFQQTWFNSSTTPASLDAVWNKFWGYLYAQGTAPVWVGEFGTDNTAADVSSATPGSQGQWFASLVSYLTANQWLNWTYWALNGEDSYALLDNNYDAAPVSAAKQNLLAAIEFPLPGTSTG